MHPRSSNPSVNGCSRSSMASSTSCSQGFPLAVENSMDGTAFCLVTATMETKFPMLHSITFFPFAYLGVSPVGHE